MSEPIISRGFRGRRPPGPTAGRLPPGQYETRDFPVLSAGPTPRITHATWDLAVRGPSGPAARWTWDEFQALPHEVLTRDIHCVTKWSKLDTLWEGVSLDTLLNEALTLGTESAAYVLAVSGPGRRCRRHPRRTSLKNRTPTRLQRAISARREGARLRPLLASNRGNAPSAPAL